MEGKEGEMKVKIWERQMKRGINYDFLNWPIILIELNAFNNVETIYYWIYKP